MRGDLKARPRSGTVMLNQVSPTYEGCVPNYKIILGGSR